MAIELGMCSEFVLALHGEITFDGLRLAGMYPQAAQSMRRVHGYEVQDLGRDVPIEEFVKKAQELNADVVGLSAMMTTTQVGQKKLEQALKDAGLRDKVKNMVGGAVATDHWKKRIEADLFGETPQDTIDKLGEI